VLDMLLMFESDMVGGVLAVFALFVYVNLDHVLKWLVMKF